MKNKISKLLIVLVLISIIVPIKGVALENNNLYKDDDYYDYDEYDDHGDYGEYDEPDEWSYRDDWDDELDEDWESKDDLEGLAAIGIAMIILFIIVFVISSAIKLVEAIGFWKIFKKAGEPGYAALIPIYNEYVKTKIGGSAWWWLLVVYGSLIIGALGSAVTAGLSSIISMASLVGRLAINYNICKKFHKDMGYTLLITFLPFVGAPMLGFSKDAEYDANVVTSEYGIFESMDKSPNNSTTIEYCQYCGEKVSGKEKFCKNCGNKI